MKRTLPLQTFLLEIRYDGLLFGGWQIQEGRRVRTVQAELEKALRGIFHKKVRVAAAGRTDRGVHAHAQTVSFSVNSNIPDQGLLRALNSALPDDIRVSRVWRMREGFNARFNAISKIYRYVIRNSPEEDVFSRHYCWWVKEPLAVEKMRDAARPFIGIKDFGTFANEQESYHSCVREVMDITFTRKGDTLVIAIEATGFLRKMVRNIVGFLVEVGKGRRPACDAVKVLRQKDRSSVGRPAPACGLYLWKVKYPRKCYVPADSRGITDKD